MSWNASRKDFWNDPERWDGIDPHVECFWMRRRKDVIDVREKPQPAPQSSPYTNVAPYYLAGAQQAVMSQSVMAQAQLNALNAYPSERNVWRGLFG